MFQQLLVTRQGYESGLPWSDSNYVSHSFRNTGLSTDSSTPSPPSTSSSESSSDSSSSDSVQGRNVMRFSVFMGEY